MISYLIASIRQNGLDVKYNQNLRFLVYLHLQLITTLRIMAQHSLYLVIIIPLLSIALAVLEAYWATKREKVSKCFAWLYRLELLFPFLWIAVFSLCGILPLSTVFIFLTLPVAVGCGETMKKVGLSKSTEIIGSLHFRTIRFMIMFMIILAASLLLGRFF